MTDITEFPPAQDFAAQNLRINSVHAGINCALPLTPFNTSFAARQNLKAGVTVLCHSNFFLRAHEMTIEVWRYT
nr:MAG TPA: hypothetical protein [Caudoviricetes sp.]